MSSTYFIETFWLNWMAMITARFWRHYHVELCGQNLFCYERWRVGQYHSIDDMTEAGFRMHYGRTVNRNMRVLWAIVDFQNGGFELWEAAANLAAECRHLRLVGAWERDVALQNTEHRQSTCRHRAWCFTVSFDWLFRDVVVLMWSELRFISSQTF